MNPWQGAVPVELKPQTPILSLLSYYWSPSIEHRGSPFKISENVEFGFIPVGKASLKAPSLEQ